MCILSDLGKGGAAVRYHTDTAVTSLRLSARVPAFLSDSVLRPYVATKRTLKIDATQNLLFPCSTSLGKVKWNPSILP
jgi:hypothetical protein